MKRIATSMFFNIRKRKLIALNPKSSVPSNWPTYLVKGLLIGLCATPRSLVPKFDSISESFITKFCFKMSQKLPLVKEPRKNARVT